jgi:hypothetical protein
MVDEQILESLGLSKNEAKVYLALNKLGSAPAGKIAEVLKLHRTNIYDALDRLYKKSLVSHFTKDKVKVFSTTNPNALLNLLDDKRNSLQSILPSLALNHQISKIQTKTGIYEGIGAYKNQVYALLDFQKPILMYGIPKYASELTKTWVMNYHKERVLKKINMKHIYNAGAKERIDLLNRLPYTEAKYLPKEYDSPVSTIICGSVVLICFWSLKPFLIIKIESEELSTSYERYFELLWSLAKE